MCLCTILPLCRARITQRKTGSTPGQDRVRNSPCTDAAHALFTRFAAALLLPYLPFRSIFGFVPLPAPLLLSMIGLTVAYVFAVEFAKKRFYARAGNANTNK